jgi:hypothetical protein
MADVFTFANSNRKRVYALQAYRHQELNDIDLPSLPSLPTGLRSLQTPEPTETHVSIPAQANLLVAGVRAAE